MVKVTISGVIPASVPADGWIVEYRIKGSAGAYITAPGSPFSSLPIEFTTTDPAGTLYEGKLRCDCGAAESSNYTWETPCECTDGTYVVGPSGTQCEKYETAAPTITSSGYCLAASTNTVYSSFESRIYKPGFTNADLFLPAFTVGGNIEYSLTLAGQWANPALSSVLGPLNREGVWIDNDCDGNKDALTAGVSTTIAAQFVNPGATKTIFIGVGGDNQFKVVVNGITVADTETTPGDFQFKIWHIIPIEVIPGINYINIIGIGDGSVGDSIGFAIYDNTSAQIAAATNDSSLTILAKSSSLRGTGFDVATCAPGWSLDISGGAGSYICRRTLIKTCNSAT